MLGYVLGHDREGRAVISLTTQESLDSFDWDKSLFSVAAGQTHTFGGSAIGVAFYDEMGKEINRILFIGKPTPQRFIAPFKCEKIGFL
ncbi:hypothetical protein A1A1_16765 [Planococcus antarcticus DSM 14505]|uniref:Uncharacterized protein n=1 Tax=Planococcus antarcticus DSM 14505 TaxID=1185653 RepID=A0AA87IIH3_9BACL|nr:hypothetical protein [Planococcus antarcticus]EIM05335.1 hypothetical protein A1A1_16765 [Planococcus antarcticus DSM 14505]